MDKDSDRFHETRAGSDMGSPFHGFSASASESCVTCGELLRTRPSALAPSSAWSNGGQWDPKPFVRPAAQLREGAAETVANMAQACPTLDSDR